MPQPSSQVAHGSSSEPSQSARSSPSPKGALLARQTATQSSLAQPSRLTSEKKYKHRIAVGGEEEDEDESEAGGYAAGAFRQDHMKEIEVNVSDALHHMEKYEHEHEHDHEHERDRHDYYRDDQHDGHHHRKIHRDDDIWSSSSNSEDSEGSEAESRRKAKEAKLKKKLNLRKMLRHGCDRCKQFAKWIVKRAWEELTCHYRKRRLVLEKNEWMERELKDRHERVHTIKKKHQDNYLEHIKDLVMKYEHRGALGRQILFCALFILRASNLWRDLNTFASNGLGYVHKSTGLPRRLMEWWQFQELLHEGAHGRVYQAVDSKGRTVAVKIRDKSLGRMLWLPLGRANATLRREVTPHRFQLILRLLAHCGLVRKPFDHQHFAKFYAVFNNAEFYVEVSEFMAGGSLLSYCEDVDGVVDENAVCKVFTRILVALEYLHGRKLIHRDLRLSQVLLGQKHDLEQVKISDFWFMAKVPKKSFFNDHRLLPGDIATRAPEVILRGEWSAKADIWSAGCMLFELLFGHPPFGGHGEALVDRICNQKQKGPEFDVLCGRISDEGMDLLRQMLRRNPFTRPDAETLLEHKWFREFGGEHKASTNRSMAEMQRTRSRRIRRVYIYGKEPGCRRGMPAKNLLSAKSGMFNSGFCTRMGETRCNIDLIVGDVDDESSDGKQFWVKSIMVSLWGGDDNPRKITVYGAQRPNIPWVELGEHNVKSIRSSEARLVIDKPLRFVRLSFSGNFGGVHGIALQKLIFYGFELRSEPIVFQLSKIRFARGAEAFVHSDTIKESDFPQMDKAVKDTLERGARIPGTGQRYYVYRDIMSGQPHTTTVAQMYTKLHRGSTICAAALSLRYAAYAPSSSHPPRLRIGIDAEEGRQVMVVTRELATTSWPPEEVFHQGYVDLETLWVTDLHVSTDNGFALEIHFENNSGYLHVPSDIGLTLYTISDIAENSDDSDLEQQQAAAKQARMHRREGMDMAQLAGVFGGEQQQDSSDQQAQALAALKGKDQDEAVESVISEGQERIFQDDLKEMQKYIKYGRWGAGDFTTGDVKAYHPRERGRDGGRAFEKGVPRGVSRASELPDDREDLQKIRVEQENTSERWWEGRDSDEHLSTTSSSEVEAEQAESEATPPPEETETKRHSILGSDSEAGSWNSDEARDEQQRRLFETQRPSQSSQVPVPAEEEQDKAQAEVVDQRASTSSMTRTEAENNEQKEHIKKLAEEAKGEIKTQLELRSHIRQEERKVRLYQQLEAAANAEKEVERLGQWEEVAEYWKEKGHRLAVNPDSLSARGQQLSARSQPGSARGQPLSARGNMLSPSRNSRSQGRHSSFGDVFGGGARTARQKIEDQIAAHDRRQSIREDQGDQPEEKENALDCLCPAAKRPCCSNAYGKLQSSLPQMLAPFTPPVPPSTPRAAQIPASSAASTETSDAQSKVTDGLDAGSHGNAGICSVM